MPPTFAAATTTWRRPFGQKKRAHRRAVEQIEFLARPGDDFPRLAGLGPLFKARMMALPTRPRWPATNIFWKNSHGNKSRCRIQDPNADRQQDRRRLIA